MDRIASRLVTLNKGFGQVRQFAAEKLGTAEEITDLPQEYKDLEKRVDALRTVHTNLLRITRIHTNSSYDYPSQLQESVVELSRNVQDQLKVLTQSPAERAESVSRQADPVQALVPKTLPHALARASAQGAELLGTEDPLGIALIKYAAIQERIGEHRIKMDEEITQKFVQPFNTTLNTSIQFAMKARRNVQSTRLALDAAKARYKNTKAEKNEAARLEIEQAEDQFVAAVEEGITLMRAVLDNPEPLCNLADLVTAQLTFHKEAYEALAELAPEIDEIQVTQEALYRNSRND